MANIFPKSANAVPLKIVVVLILISVALTIGARYYLTPSFSRIGYQPIQPVAFDHNLHTMQLGIDCRYCHTYVEQSEHSNVPATSTCMNCHSQVQVDNPLLELVRESARTGEPIPWVKVHKTPDYVFFNHAVHVNRGISCVECHGQVNEMDVVYQAKSHSMGFCLECHRDPAQFVRPLDKVYDLTWKPESPEQQREQGEKFVHAWDIQPPQSCSGCHR